MTFRILSLDGGGIRGAFQARFIAECEDRSGQSAGDCFDLIVGTSTGAILAAGLSVGLPASTISDLYERHGLEIFGRRRGVGLARARYDAEPLESALRAVFGEKTLQHCRTPICVTTLNATTGAPRILKTRHHDDYTRDWRIPIVDAVMASAAAPSYFRGRVLDDGGVYVDGGLYANNPSIVGVWEATTRLGQRIEEIDVLALGTGIDAGVAPRRALANSIFSWRNALVPNILAAQTRAADYQMRILQNTVGLIYRRYEPSSIRPGRLDDARNIRHLQEAGQREASNDWPRLAEVFLPIEHRIAQLIPAIEGDVRSLEATDVA